MTYPGLRLLHWRRSGLILSENRDFCFMAKDRNIFDEDREERSVRNLWRSIDRANDAPEERGGRIAWTISTLVVAAAIFSAVVWYSYPGSKSVRNSLSAPVIRADSGAYRIAPDAPGGMEIADSQSTVFDAMRGPPGAKSADATPPVENLLAAGDEPDPVPRDRLFAGLNTKSSIEGTEDQKQETASAPSAPAPSQSEDLLTMGSPLAPKAAAVSSHEDKVLTLSAAEPSSVAQTSPAANSGVQAHTAETEKAVDEEKKAETLAKTEPAAGAAAPVAKIVKKADAEKESASVKAAKPKAASAASAIKKPAPGSYYVQVASVPTRGHASKEWAVLQTKYTDLKPLSMRVQEAALSKGTFYRVQAGPMAKADADRICAAIKARKPGGCLVVRQ